MMDLERVNAYMARVSASEKQTFRPVSDKLKVGLDLGTAYIVLVVLDEENNPVACEKQAASVLRGTHTTDVCKIHPFSRRQKGGSACTDKALPIFDSLAAGKLQFPLHRMYPADPSPHVQVQLHAAGQLLQAAIRKQTRPIQRPFYVICGQHRIGGRKSLIAQYMDFSLGIARTNSARCMITRISKSNDCVVYYRAPPFCRKIAEFFPLFLF